MKILFVLCAITLTGCSTKPLTPHEVAMVCRGDSIKEYRVHTKDHSLEFECKGRRD